MTPARILPDLQGSFLCEDVRQETSGNFIVIGMIGVIRVPQLPIAAYKLCVFNRWTAGVGTFTESVRLVAPDQTTVLRHATGKFALQDPVHHHTSVTVFPQVEFKTPGAYFVEVAVDDVMKLRYPIPLVVVPQPNAQQGQRPGGQPQPPPTPTAPTAPTDAAPPADA